MHAFTPTLLSDLLQYDKYILVAFRRIERAGQENRQTLTTSLCAGHPAYLPFFSVYVCYLSTLTEGSVLLF